MTEYQRIEELLKFKKMSARALAIALGLKSPQIFYDIKAGKCGISKELALRIQERFLNVSTSWLLTGEGTMLKDESFSQTTHGDNSPNVNGDNNTVGDNNAIGCTELLSKALDEISEQRKLFEMSQNEISEMRKALTDAIRANQDHTSQLLKMLNNLTTKSDEKAE